jgi:hypothetical protein
MLEEFSQENDIEMYSKEELNELMVERMKISKRNTKMLKLNDMIISSNMSQLGLYENVLDVESDVMELYQVLNQLNHRIRNISEKIALKDMMITQN